MTVFSGKYLFLSGESLGKDPFVSFGKVRFSVYQVFDGGFGTQLSPRAKDTAGKATRITAARTFLLII